MVVHAKARLILGARSLLRILPLPLRLFMLGSLQKFVGTLASSPTEIDFEKRFKSSCLLLTFEVLLASKGLPVLLVPFRVVELV